MDLYLATNGPGWVSNANWLSGDPCSNSWAGISCPSGLITKMCVRLLCPDIDGALTGSECAIGIVFWRPIASTERYQPPLQTLPIFNSCTHIRDDAFPCTTRYLTVLIARLADTWATTLSKEPSRQPSGRSPIFSTCTRTITKTLIMQLIQVLVSCVPQRSGLFNNQLNGTFPSIIGSLTNLQSLYENYHNKASHKTRPCARNIDRLTQVSASCTMLLIATCIRINSRGAFRQSLDLSRIFNRCTRAMQQRLFPSNAMEATYSSRENRSERR